MGGPSHSKLRLRIPANLVGAEFEESSQMHFQGQQIEQSAKPAKNMKLEDLLERCCSFCCEDVEGVKRDLFKGFASMSSADDVQKKFEEWTSALPQQSLLSNVVADATALTVDEAALSVLTTPVVATGASTEIVGSLLPQAAALQVQDCKSDEIASLASMAVSDLQESEDRSGKKWTDVGSTVNQAAATCQHSLEELPEEPFEPVSQAVCGMGTSTGIEDLRRQILLAIDQCKQAMQKGSLTEDTTFLVECQSRVAVALAWLGRAFEARQSEPEDATIRATASSWAPVLKEGLEKLLTVDMRNEAAHPHADKTDDALGLEASPYSRQNATDPHMLAVHLEMQLLPHPILAEGAKLQSYLGCRKLADMVGQCKDISELEQKKKDFDEQKVHLQVLLRCLTTGYSEVLKNIKRREKAVTKAEHQRKSAMEAENKVRAEKELEEHRKNVALASLGKAFAVDMKQHRTRRTVVQYKDQNIRTNQAGH
eukprot:1593769-Amphidinium_carterae.3